MPILFVHGVNTRSQDSFKKTIKPYLKRLVAPAISSDPDNVLIDDVYWGNIASNFYWDGDSRPRSRFLGMGATAAPDLIATALASLEHAKTIDSLPSQPAASSKGGLISGGGSSSATPSHSAQLKDLTPEQLSDFLADVIADSDASPEERVKLAIVADEVALLKQTATGLGEANSFEEELETLLNQLKQASAQDGLLAQGGWGNWLKGIGDRIGETYAKSRGLPAYAISALAAEIRGPLNDFISVFIGDVMEYLNRRQTAENPGEIPSRALHKLKLAHENKLSRDQEPLVVLTHSMGGQIIYDVVTTFLCKNDKFKDIKIDFWCSTASQVGFFEELKLFLASDKKYMKGNPVPFPAANLGVWWNVWDYNDFISYTAQDIIQGVDDGPYVSGMSLLAAHGGYLHRPSFYRAFHDKLVTAKARGFVS